MSRPPRPATTATTVHPGIAITAATGDAGYGVELSGLLPRRDRRGWDDTLAGQRLEPWLEQNCLVRPRQRLLGRGASAHLAGSLSNITGVCTKRAVADVAAVADPNTGVAVYDTYGLRGWTVFGGTSVSTQIIAGVYALAGGLGGATAASGLYVAAPGDLFDIASGSNSSCGSALCTAGVGWDGPTGLGSPDGIGAF